MKILLVGNYDLVREKSMQRFASVLEAGLRARGHEVRLIRPPVVVGRIPVSGAWRKWRGYVDKFVLFPPALEKAMHWADVIHICDHSNSVYCRYLKSRPYALTCHDMLAIRSAQGDIPENPTSWTGRHLQRMIARGLQKAKHIVCVSETTRSEFVHLTDCKEKNIRTIHNGLNFPYAPQTRSAASNQIVKFGMRLEQRYILHVGGNAWYKNRLGLLKLFRLARRLPNTDGVRLVMAGARMTAAMKKYIREYELEDQVLEIVDPSNEGLRALYSCAELMIFPSLREGFGWPIIEAQACGCPVVTSDRAPMNEIGGDAAIYIDPDDLHSAAVVVAQNIGHRIEPCERSLKNAARFDTDTMIAQYEAFFQQILAPTDSDEVGQHEDYSLRELAC